MKKFDFKSIVLGIGIGMIVTSILGMVYASGYIYDNKNLMKNKNNSVNSYYSTENDENDSNDDNDGNDGNDSIDESIEDAYE